jgi:translation initiation factor 2B subunit (eIF-2B alpha/beta/delta family)
MPGSEGIRNLSDGIELLKSDRTNGARVLATNALRTLQVVISSNNDTSTSARQLWARIRHAGYRLSLARPSMGAAITSAVANGLHAIRQGWEKRLGADWLSATDLSKLDQMKKTADEALQTQIQRRVESSKHLADAFAEYLRQSTTISKACVSILTLSSSSTITACLGRAVRAFPEISFTISVLESRPGMEGATFATSFLEDLNKGNGIDNVNMSVAPDSHVCALAQTTDILLLGADRVSGKGDVSNKMGSLSAAMAAKTLSNADVVIVTEADKIARPASVEEHKDEDNDPEEVYARWPKDARARLVSMDKDKITIRNTYFEWVPRRYVDAYITEDGVIDTNNIHTISQEKGKLEDELFDREIMHLPGQAEP